jgi:hypothetical protein
MRTQSFLGDLIISGHVRLLKSHGELRFRQPVSIPQCII